MVVRPGCTVVVRWVASGSEVGASGSEVGCNIGSEVGCKW